MFRITTAFAAMLAFGCVGSIAAAERKPNILVLLADDLGYADVGFQGCKDIPTPHIDALAHGGVRCTSGYVSGPYCSPTRAGLLTGRYQQRFGHEFNPGPRGEPFGGDSSIGLPLSETTFADRLRAAGYATGAVGKWHLGVAPKFNPLQRGFDEYFGFLGGAHVYAPGMTDIVFPGIQRRPAERVAPILRGTAPVNEREYLTDAFAREAISFIDRHQKQPFFLYLAFNAVHTPMNATDNRLKQFESVTDPMRRTYCAMTLALDEAIGKVIDKLRSTDLENDTLIFFCSDNGGPTVPRAALNASRNTPLRGSKVSTLEGGIRVPFVVSWKGKLPPGQVYDQPVIQLDFLRTALAAAGVEAQPEWKLDGVNLIPYFTGEAAGVPHEAVYWRLGPQMAIRKGDWKLVKYSYEFAAEKPPRADALISPPRLYNLSQDIGEQHDRAGAQLDKVNELQRLWDEWDKTLAAPLWPQQSSAPRQ
ncbi:MAG TPA: sulfatase [Planctomycetaceae bacterium]|nr:sulfatase [Planctomycetaceae bacterium]